MPASSLPVTHILKAVNTNLTKQQRTSNICAIFPMALRQNTVITIKCLALIFLTFMSFCNKGFAAGFEHGELETASTLFHKGVGTMNHRRVLGVDAGLYDYDDAGANTKHEPRKSKPGSGGNKNT